MRLLPIVATLAAAVFLSACDDKVECTEELAQAKATEMTNKIMEMAMSDPAKVAALEPRMKEIGDKLGANPDDLQAVCAAMDEIMAELE